MKNANYFHGSSFWVGTLAILGLFLLALPNSDMLAAPANSKVSFDHLKTGFPLTGAHVTVPCETCHIQGTFKGTPKNCVLCHTQGSRIQTTTFKPANHIPTTQACQQCHTSTTSWSVASFSHVGVMPHQCSQCHNNSITKGKPANHMPTNEPCDTCHRTTTWMSASFSHVSVMPGTCATCHTAGGSGMAKPPNHIPTNLSCDACHTTGGSFTTSRFTHSATQGVIPGQCSTCHNGSYTQWNALGKPSGHVATTASCDSCHTAGYSTFAGAGFNHTGVAPGSCATCHVQGGSGMAKPTNHIPTNTACDACHNTSTFATSTFTHSATQGVLPGQCASSGCHSGTYTTWNAQGKPANHLATSASCDSCHAGFTTFANGVFNHTGIAPGTCSTCHTPGGSGLAAPTNHIPYASQLLAGSSMNCDACHSSTTSFTVEKMNHNGSQGNGAGWCKGCHQSGTSFLGNMQKKSLTHQKSTGVTDCSQSGCHRPLGNTGNAYTNWN